MRPDDIVAILIPESDMKLQRTERRWYRINSINAYFYIRITLDSTGSAWSLDRKVIICCAIGDEQSDVYGGSWSKSWVSTATNIHSVSGSRWHRYNIALAFKTKRIKLMGPDRIYYDYDRERIQEVEMWRSKELRHHSLKSYILTYLNLRPGRQVDMSIHTTISTLKHSLMYISPDSILMALSTSWELLAGQL